MNITDEKLETYITKIKNSNNSHNKLLNYKKATARINELKADYNKLSNKLKGKTKKKSAETTEKSNIEDIVNKLNEIGSELDAGSSDMNELIDKYLQYKSLLNDLQTESEQIKNEIYKVDETKNKIVLHKLQHDEIL